MDYRKAFELLLQLLNYSLTKNENWDSGSNAATTLNTIINAFESDKRQEFDDAYNNLITNEAAKLFDVVPFIEDLRIKMEVRRISKKF